MPQFSGKPFLGRNILPQIQGKIFLGRNILSQIQGKIFLGRNILSQIQGKIFLGRNIMPQIQGKKFLSRNNMPQIQGKKFLGRNIIPQISDTFFRPRNNLSGFWGCIYPGRNALYCVQLSLFLQNICSFQKKVVFFPQKERYDEEIDKPSRLGHQPTHLGEARLINERDEKGVCAVAPECAIGRLYGLVRTTHYTQRGGYRVVSDVVYKRDTVGVHRIAEGGVAQVPATLWLWGAVRIPLDIVLWQH